MRISVVGLGKLGAPLAAVLADSGHIVVGVDVNKCAVDAINMGVSPVSEPGVAEAIGRNRSRLTATSDFDVAISQTELTFVVVPTPSSGDGSFSLEFLLDAVGSIGSSLRRKRGFHVVVITSTVVPGSIAGFVIPKLEVESQKRCGIDFGVCYGPEFIALGSVVRMQPWHSSQYPTLPEVYVQNASLEIAWSRVVFDGRTISGSVLMPFLTQDDEGLDVNTEADWNLAEFALASGRASLPQISSPPLSNPIGAS